MNMKKYPALLLCCAAVLSCLFGCSREDPPAETGTGTAPATTASPGVVTRPADEDDIPFETDFKGAGVDLLCWAEKSDWEWGLSDGSGDALRRAIFEKKEKVENRLNIRVSARTVTGDWSGRKEFLAAVKADGSAPDLVLQNSAVVGTLAVQGCYADLSTVDFVNFDKPWWPGNQQKTCSIRGKLYAALGDASVTLREETQCILANADLIASQKLDSPETAVSSGAWTAEFLLQTLQNANLPRNADGTSARKATFAGNTACDAMIYGGGYTVSELTDGVPALSVRLTSPEFGQWFSFWSAFTQRQDVQTLPPSGTDGFASGNVLFHFGTLSDVRRYLPNAAFRLSFLPYPKADAGQQEYRTVCTADATAFSIPANAKDRSLSGALLEATASYGYHVTSPAYLANLMQNPRLDTKFNKEAAELLHRTLTFDPARQFPEDSSCGTMFRQMAVASEGWDFIYKNNRALWEMSLKKIGEQLP